MSESWKRWQDWATVVLGVLLFVTPFAFGAALGSVVAWTAYVGGVLLVIAGLRRTRKCSGRLRHNR